MKISKIVSNSEMISNFGLSRENEAFSLVPEKSSDELSADFLIELRKSIVHLNPKRLA